MKRSGSRIAIISVLLLGALVFAGVYYAWNTTIAIFQPANAASTGQTIPFEIASGDTTATIADHLQQKGLIRNALAFRVWARIKGLDTRLQAGIYKKLSPSMTISQIIDQLLNAQPDAIRVVVPEGLRIEQIAVRFAKAGLVKFNEQDFLKYTKHIDQFPDAAKYPILKMVPAGQTMEGLLFPASYEVPVDGTARDVVNLMLKTMSDTIEQNGLDKQAQQHQLTTYQVIILASLVEREVVFDGDRAGVASVYWNRILRPNDETVGFLNSDPSVQYARDTQNPPSAYWKDLTDSGGNIAANSPWNTYTHKGWPPTPICNPGLASLMAAAAPPQTSFYFFLGKPGDGHIVFAKNKTEFDADQKKYLQK
ncbi:MAG: endolytic transglycosylase MltG [Chloroflexi bacterium]|nr:endolytic transglycosylase MltG [Chloroflexota bacterium]